eukprot:TRINITY_DN1394_c0_g2_i1.p1 TRINITY_DN1394_c0_g2~~TRINITY_DN1394_c0_g2_i1.p1  ORF type:complete len:137 (-),score=16.20 TRINITY_DN1394_c0_g2_i1:97-507(-)
MKNLIDMVSKAEILDTLVVVYGERGKQRRTSFCDQVHGAILRGRQERQQRIGQMCPLRISEAATAWVSGKEQRCSEEWIDSRGNRKWPTGSYDDNSHLCLPPEERSAVRRGLEEAGVRFMSPKECKAVHEPFKLVI